MPPSRAARDRRPRVLVRSQDARRRQSDCAQLMHGRDTFETRVLAAALRLEDTGPGGPRVPSQLACGRSSALIDPGPGRNITWLNKYNNRPRAGPEYNMT